MYMALRRPHQRFNHTREVWIVTLPIRDSTPLQHSIVSWVTGRMASELDWSMHWALLVGDQYLELQRISESRIPVLKVSPWSAERVASIQQIRQVGISELQDDQISEAGRVLLYVQFYHYSGILVLQATHLLT